MQGALDLPNSETLQTGQFLIRGMKDDNDNPTQFLSDIQIGASGNYNDIEFTIGATQYSIENIYDVISNDTLICKKI